MVIIKRLVIRGFKSFANKTEMLFGSGFNCIIGPNGSGKTNISDAICFVLGKSSAHEMRAEKSANLIFNGGKKGSPAKEAEVTIEFDNSEGKFPIQSKDVKITRIVRTNGVSIYKINDEVRTRQQISDLLNVAKLDPDGHNIVLQGDIVSLAEMKSVERRQVIEEIAGISMYEEKKQKCLNELQRVDAKLNEAEIILTEREVNLRELKKERDQAAKFKELQELVKDERGTLLHLQIKEKEEKLIEIEKRKKEAEEKIQKTTEEINVIKQSVQDTKNEILKINEEVEVKGEKEQLVLRKEIEELRTVIVKANSRLEVCQNELNRIKIRKDQLINSIKEIDEKVKELKAKRQEYEQQNKQLVSEEKEVQKKINEFKEKIGIDSDFGNALEILDKQIDEVLIELGKLNDEKQIIIRNKDQVLFKLNAIEEKLSTLKASNELEDLKKGKKLLKELSEKLIKSTSEDSSYSLQLNTLRRDIAKNGEELAKHRSRQIGIQEKSLGDLAVRKILELGKSLKGIYGTVASLGDVESRYSIALEVAAGSRINSLVVDNDSTAQKCIEHLKSNKLGIATFLPINKIKSRVVESGVKELLTQKGVYGLAVDLVEYDPRYKDVFSYTFGSTLIVDSIEVARRIGIGRARMVTLEGDLMEPSGAMVGGYRAQKLGFGFKEKEINETVIGLEEELNKQRTLLDHIEKKKVANEEIIYQLRTEKANIEADIIKLEKTLGIGEYIDKLIDSKKEFVDEQKEYDKELEELEEKVIVLNKTLEDIKIKKHKLKEKLADPNLAKNIEAVENQKLKLREKVLEISASMKNIDTQINSMLMPERDKIEKIIKQHDKEFENFTKELAEIKEILKKREQELKVKEQEEKKFYSNVKDLVGKRNKLQEKVQSYETAIAREEEKLRSNEQRVNSINIDRAKAVAEFEALQKEFEPFKDAKIKRGIAVEELRLKVREDEKELSHIGNVNLRALEVYEQIQQEYEKIVDKVIKLKVEKEDVLKMMAEVESKKKDIFMKTYNVLIKNFKNIFGQLTTKGEVQVNLENEENPFEGGVDIQVRVVGNKFLDMRSLSGGEKTLAALAFIFAIQEYDPSPFYLLDEVDAALDKRNSELLSKLIHKYSDKAQYVVISHNDNIITEAGYIYGVSMQDSISKVVSLKV